MNIKLVPEGYASLRQAFYATAAVMHAGLAVAEAVEKARSLGLQVDFSREELKASAARFWAEVDSSQKPGPGGRPIHIWAENPTTGGMFAIELDLLRSVPFALKLGNLSYLRSTHPEYESVTERLGKQPGKVGLLIRAADLDRLLKNIRRTRKRKLANPPQRDAKAIGRPGKREEVERAILQIVNEQNWHGAQSLKRLTSLLGRRLYSMSVSESTVRRTVDAVFDRTGDRRFERLRKASRQIAPVPA